MVWAERMCSIITVLWPTSKDCVCDGAQEWVITDSYVELGHLLWGDVYVVYGNVNRYLWGIRWCIAGECICYQYFLTREVLMVTS